MSTEFVSLNEVFLPVTGGDIEGSLDVNGLLTVNDKSGNGTVYDVADEIAQLRAENEELKVALDSVSPYKAGDTFSFDINTSGYLTSSATSVRFIMPLTRQVASGVTVSVSDAKAILRQNGSYTHGSSASVGVAPDSIDKITVKPFGLEFWIIFNTTTNATNNDAIGINFSGTINFS